MSGGIEAGLEGSIYAGLETLVAREWQRDDGVGLRIERLLIDANWSATTDVVYQFSRQSKHSAVLIPSHGQYVEASGRAMTDRKPKRGERLGHNWLMPAVTGRLRGLRHELLEELPARSPPNTARRPRLSVIAWP